MRRTALILILTVGAVGGFASGLMSCHHRAMTDRHAFEDHVADVCTRAAERAHERAPRGEKMP